jgi:hypothetical protein
VLASPCTCSQLYTAVERHLRSAFTLSCLAREASAGGLAFTRDPAPEYGLLLAATPVWQHHLCCGKVGLISGASW